MPLYHPRILAQKLEDLILKLLSWSYSVTQMRHSALAHQSKMESQLASMSRTAGILANQLVVGQQEVAQVDAMLVAQTTYYFEMKTEVGQTCEAVQQAHNEARKVLAYWQAELVKAEQWVTSAMGALQRAENDENASLRVREAVEQASGQDETAARLREAEIQVSAARAEKKRAERELSNAQVCANNCTYAVNSAREAMRIAEAAQQYSQRGANASGRSYEHIVAAQKALDEGKMVFTREEEAIRAAEEVLKSAQTMLDDAADRLYNALLYEQSSQEYQAQARVALDGKIQALFALNQPDIYGEAAIDPSPVDSAASEGAVGAEVNSVSALSDDSSTALLEKGYTGPKSDPELQPFMARLLQRRELITSEWWSKLNEEKRMKVLKKVHGDIARAYGFPPCEIEVYALRPKLHGSFNEDKNRIIINRNLVVKDHPRQALSTLAHESRHAYQYHAINQYRWALPPNRRYVVKLWKENWKDYQKASEGYEDYYKQPIEADARAFAEEVVRQMYGEK